MTLVYQLPNEVLLQVFALCDLSALIQGRGVCHLWHSILPSADIHPIRHDLLRIYDKLCTLPLFLSNRERYDQVLQPFDRQEYVNVLTRQLQSRHPHASLPVAFEMFILEWPARAVFDCAWPGLPFEWILKGLVWGLGWNLLANIPPQLFELEMLDGCEECQEYADEDTSHILASLPMWEADHGRPVDWLVMDPTHCFFGWVLKVNTVRAYHDPEYFWRDPHGSDCKKEGCLKNKQSYWKTPDNTQKPFIDWLKEKALDLELTEAEDVEWREALPPRKMTGGDLGRFKPITEPVAPLPQGRAAQAEFSNGQHRFLITGEYIRDRDYDDLPLS